MLAVYTLKITPSHAQREREREKLYIFSSHLGLIRCLTPIRVNAIIYSQAFLDKYRNTADIILPHKLKDKSPRRAARHMPIAPLPFNGKPGLSSPTLILLSVRDRGNHSLELLMSVNRLNKGPGNENRM